jgi:hypothetical protein
MSEDDWVREWEAGTRTVLADAVAEALQSAVA